MGADFDGLKIAPGAQEETEQQLEPTSALDVHALASRIIEQRSGQELLLESEIQIQTLKSILEAKKENRLAKIENSPIAKRWHEFKKWYSKLDETAKGRVGKQFLKSGLSGLFVLGTSLTAGSVAPIVGITHFGVKVAAATAFQAGAGVSVSVVEKKKPGFFNKIVNVMNRFGNIKDNETITAIPNFSQENMNFTDAPTTPEGNTNITQEKIEVAPSLKEVEDAMKKFRYLGMALGTTFVLVMMGWLAAVAVGGALGTKEGVSELLKSKIAEYEAKIANLSETIKVNSEHEELVANLKNVNHELELLMKKISKLETTQKAIKEIVTFLSSVVKQGMGLPSGTSVLRNVFTTPFNEAEKVAKAKAQQEVS